ncbi:hypothetical protein ACQSDJ_17420 [Salmonella enterica]|uniref:hypothetical protein n=1 Tax=Salmonella enterica TaxID=28901 RepID=UPI003D31DC08
MATAENLYASKNNSWIKIFNLSKSHGKEEGSLHEMNYTWLSLAQKNAAQRQERRNVQTGAECPG